MDNTMCKLANNKENVLDNHHLEVGKTDKKSYESRRSKDTVHIKRLYTSLSLETKVMPGGETFVWHKITSA